MLINIISLYAHLLDVPLRQNTTKNGEFNRYPPGNNKKPKISYFFGNNYWKECELVLLLNQIRFTLTGFNGLIAYDNTVTMEIKV